MALPVLIVGASFGGLCLARKLAQRGIAAIVFEGHGADRAQNHGVALHEWALKPLLSLLHKDEDALRKATAVNAARGGRGEIGGVRYDAATGEKISASAAPPSTSFRAHRPSFLKLLRDGVDVRFEKRFTSFESSEDRVKVHFEDGTEAEGCLLVGADGVHSKIRAQLLPSSGFDILPYAVYYGQQHLSSDDGRYALLGDGTELQASKGATALTIKVNEISSKTLKIGWTYSRPATQDDPLLQPARRKEAAHDLPPQLLEEMRELSPHCAEPFASLLDTGRQKQEGDRMVHWLQRNMRIPLETLLESAAKRVVLLGDAAHAMPLLTADGANYALTDAIRLGEVDGLDIDMIEGVRRYYHASFASWQDGMEESARRLSIMHGRD